jgi:hypothetical protein
MKGVDGLRFKITICNLKLREGAMTRHSSVILVERIEHAILLARGEKVLLDEDLAALYGVSTKVLVQAVKRNLERFPRGLHVSIDRERV